MAPILPRLASFIARSAIPHVRRLSQAGTGQGNDGSSGVLDDETTDEKPEYNFKTAMKQWNKDLEGIERRSKARRKQQMIQDVSNEIINESKPKENEQRFDYLTLEKRKASEAWGNARHNQTSTPTDSYPWKTNTMHKPVKDLSKKSPNISNSPSNIRLPTRDNTVPFEKKVLRKLDYLQPIENKKQKEVLENAKNSEALWERKFDRARRQREKLLQNLSDIQSQDEHNRVMRFKINLSRWETEKYKTMKTNYLKELNELEMKLRESAKCIRRANKELQKKK